MAWKASCFLLKSACLSHEHRILLQNCLSPPHLHSSYRTLQKEEVTSNLHEASNMIHLIIGDLNH